MNIDVYVLSLTLTIIFFSIKKQKIFKRLYKNVYLDECCGSVTSGGRGQEGRGGEAARLQAHHGEHLPLPEED